MGNGPRARGGGAPQRKKDPGWVDGPERRSALVRDVGVWAQPPTVDGRAASRPDPPSKASPRGRRTPSPPPSPARGEGAGPPSRLLLCPRNLRAPAGRAVAPLSLSRGERGLEGPPGVRVRPCGPRRRRRPMGGVGAEPPHRKEIRGWVGGFERRVARARPGSGCGGRSPPTADERAASRPHPPSWRGAALRAGPSPPPSPSGRGGRR